LKTGIFWFALYEMYVLNTSYKPVLSTDDITDPYNVIHEIEMV
jgi:hypothetical protein